MSVVTCYLRPHVINCTHTILRCCAQSQPVVQKVWIRVTIDPCTSHTVDIVTLVVTATVCHHGTEVGVQVTVSVVVVDAVTCIARSSIMQ